MIIAVTVVFALIAVGLVVYLRTRSRASVAAPAGPLPPLPLPGPRPWPLIGNLLELDSTAPHVALTRLAGRFGPVFGLQLGSVFTVVLADAELIRQALRSESLCGRAPLYVTHGIMGGYGLICSEGDLWKDQRRLSIGWLKTLGMIKFGSARDRLVATIAASCTESIDTLRAVAGQPIDPLPTLQHTIGNIMNALVFGRRYELTDPTWLYLQHLQEEGVRHIGVSGAVNFLPWLRHLPGQRRVLRFLLDGKRQTHRIYDKIIADVRRTMAERSDTDGQPPPASIVELFLRERDARRQSGSAQQLAQCGDEQLRHLLADLFGAGVDTTLNTLRWFLLYVARDPLVQKRLRAEMAARLAPSGRPPCEADRDRLPYLRAAIAEAQRIRSVVPLGIPHGLTADMLLAGHRLPAGAMVIPLQWAVHMNATSWPEPECFRPERFICERTGEFRAPPAFMPFQTGRRMCPGDELARMMLFEYGGRLVHAFGLRCGAAVSVTGECGITLTPPRGHEIAFEPLRPLVVVVDPPK